MKQSYKTVVAFLTVAGVIISSNLLVWAHSINLGIQYDDCEPHINCDSDEEMWYYIGSYRHFR